MGVARARRWLSALRAGCLLLACGPWAGCSSTRVTPQLNSTRVELRAPVERPLAAPLWVQDVGFDAPESVLHDARADLYLVSNVVGPALARDDRAFIARVRPDGTLDALKWIDAAQPEVELHAPKGMVLVDEVLYVADIDRVRKFERRSGRPLGVIEVQGASFLHDLSADGRGNVYVSDSGLGQGLSASGSDAIYRIARDGSLTALAKSRTLGQPSGLWFDVAARDATSEQTKGGLWVTSFGTGELYWLDAAGVRSPGQRLSKGSLDGIVMHGSTLFVSSWEAGAVYEQTANGFVPRITELDAPADLGIDHKRRRLLVTHYNQAALSVHPL